MSGIQRQRILIVEDEKPLREAFAFLLESEGFVVELAENGKVGLRKLHDFQPQLILLDMLMPVMNGRAFLEAARLPQSHPAVKVLLLSNLSDPMGIDAAQLYGVTDTVLKADLSPSELAGRARSLLAGFGLPGAGV